MRGKPNKRRAPNLRQTARSAEEESALDGFVLGQRIPEFPRLQSSSRYQKDNA